VYEYERKDESPNPEIQRSSDLKLPPVEELPSNSLPDDFKIRKPRNT